MTESSNESSTRANEQNLVQLRTHSVFCYAEGVVLNSLGSPRSGEPQVGNAIEQLPQRGCTTRGFCRTPSAYAKQASYFLGWLR